MTQNEKHSDHVGKYVVVTDAHRDIVAGEVIEQNLEERTITLRNCRVCYSYIHRDGHPGISGLSTAGPGEGSKILRPIGVATCLDIVRVAECTPEARAAWESDDVTWK